MNETNVRQIGSPDNAWNQNLLTEWHIRYRGPGIMIYWHLRHEVA
ncbi:MAG TPA: Tn3 family transposase [Ktedonobacteraceae bacterium]|nr:Tn3 family transposase [Ktedonobacteraceae bacterium]